MLKVWVIGTEPPCPRCDRLVRMVEEVMQSRRDISLDHNAYDTPQAGALAERMGKRIGTAKDVARAAGIRVDWKEVYAEIARAQKAAGPGAQPADSWTPKLDALLKPCQEAADGADYLMTPVLVVNGEVRHHGNVPDREQLLELLAN